MRSKDDDGVPTVQLPHPVGPRDKIRSLSEASAMMRLSHDNIIKLRDQVDNMAAFVMWVCVLS